MQQQSSTASTYKLKKVAQPQPHSWLPLGLLATFQPHTPTERALPSNQRWQQPPPLAP